MSQTTQLLVTFLRALSLAFAAAADSFQTLLERDNNEDLESALPRGPEAPRETTFRQVSTGLRCHCCNSPSLHACVWCNGRIGELIPHCGAHQTRRCANEIQRRMRGSLVRVDYPWYVAEPDNYRYDSDGTLVEDQ